MNRPSVVVFDGFGTLIRSRIPVAHAYQQAGIRHGADLTLEEIRRRFQLGRKKLFGDVDSSGQACTEESDRQRWRTLVEYVFIESSSRDVLFEELWDYFAQPENWALYDDVLGCLQRIRREKIPFAIASNFDSRLLAVCHHFEPLRQALAVFYSTAIGYAKPDPRFFQAIDSRLAVPADQLLMVGDDLENDYRAALRCGWKAILIDRDSSDRQDDGRIRSLLDLNFES